MFGLVSVILMGWDWQESFQRMFFDTGAPLWPYQTPTCLLLLFDAPALVLSRLLTCFSELGRIPMIYFGELPFVVVWWWFVGTRLDFGLIGGRLSRPKLLATILGLVGAALVVFSWLEVKDYISYWNYMKSHRWEPGWPIRFIRDSGPILWSFVLIATFLVAIKRLLRGESGSCDVPPVSRRTKLRVGVGFAVYAAFAGIVFWQIHRGEAQEQAERDLHSAIVSGKIVDDRGVPVVGIEVNLVPVSMAGRMQPYQVDYGWTDASGDYVLRPSDSREYFLAVLWKAAPSRHQPFLTRFYPDSSDESGSAKLTITETRHIKLGTMRLRRLAVVKVPVEAEWSNGKVEPDATFTFTNELYPESGAIGGEGFQPDSDGTVLIPADFDYKGGAQVECDGGSKINSPYTPPVLFTTRNGHIPTSPLKFVLPGMPCKVWHPQ